MAFPAQTVSQTIREWLHQGPLEAQVLATFEHACDLITPSGEVIALVAPSVGNGPFNVVLESPTPLLADLEPAASAELTENTITIGTFEVDLRTATVWDPKPDWSLLRTHQDGALARLPALRDLCVDLGPPGSLAPLLSSRDSIGTGDNPAVGVLCETLGALAPGWEQRSRSLRELGHRLTGLGVGLTPSGDDFLVGMMHWAWLGLPEPARFCQIVTESCNRTTSLSSALLRAATRGECNAAWHSLLVAMCAGDDSGIDRAAQAVLSFGATSGADGLTGFIWAGLAGFSAR